MSSVPAMCRFFSNHLESYKKLAMWPKDKVIAEYTEQLADCMQLYDRLRICENRVLSVYILSGILFCGLLIAIATIKHSTK